MKRLLLVEDDQDLGESLYKSLKPDYEVIWCKSYMEFSQQKDLTMDVSVVDLNLPDCHGFDIIRRIQGPVLVMTALNSPENRLQSIELGVADFIPKPFLFKELQLKIERLLAPVNKTEDLDASIDLSSRTIKNSQGTLFFLNNREYGILKLLMEKSPTVVSRDEILNALEEPEQASHRSIDNCIVKLRQYLEDEDHQRLRSVRGVGYQWFQGESNES